MATLEKSRQTDSGGRREYGRVSFLRKMTIRDITTGRTCEASGIDVNIKGVRFFCHASFEAGQRVAMQVWLDNASLRDPVWINGRVAWSQREQNGAIIGVQFDELIRPERHPKLYSIIYGETL